MTNPVILLGTQSNGETLPVQVDATGRLVAEGLPGNEGPQGPAGPPGANGGDFPLPADPYEGAILGWLNGGLAWIGTPPEPIPPGVFGPITDWDPSGILTVQGPIPDQVGNGVYLTQCNADGTVDGINPDWDIRKEWIAPPIFLTDNVPAHNEFNVVNIFDGDLATQGIPQRGSIWRWAFTEFPEVDQMRIWWEGDTNYASVNGKTLTELNPQGFNPAVLTGAVTSFESMEQNHAASAYYCYIKQIEVNGKVLVAKSVGGVYGRVNQKLSETQLLVVPQNANPFEAGKYLSIDENQRVAPWVLYGNDPTSLIDHLRSS